MECFFFVVRKVGNKAGLKAELRSNEETVGKGARGKSRD